jgi:prepilin-type N-terminal cleavage/methylation domain-containing protein
MNRRGMTLLELLIAVTLVSLLSVGMLFAIHVGLGALEASERRITVNRRSTGAQRVIEQELGGFIPARVFCGQPLAGTGDPQPFFQGEPGVLRFVSTYSLAGASRGQPQIIEMFVSPGESGQGVRFLVNEIPWRGPVGAGFFCSPPSSVAGGPPLIGFAPPKALPSSFVLADKLAFCHFFYREAAKLAEPVNPWLPRWPRSDIWPGAVRIEIAPLAPDASRVQPLTVTSILHVTKPPGEPYGF